MVVAVVSITPNLAKKDDSLMATQSRFAKMFLQEDLNFLLTNRIPRLMATRFIGWFSKIEQPLVRDLSIATWRAFSDLDLSEAKHSTFRSMHECFIRELKPGVRPIDSDPAILVSPCDAIVGASGAINGTELYQIKGFPYQLHELLRDHDLESQYRDGHFVTLRLKSSMYHRFHAPHDCTITQVDYIAGDTWNVNPIALKRVEKLFCKNERAVLQARLAGGHAIALVPVAAILVASIRLRFLDTLLHIDHTGPTRFATNAFFRKGDEMGWFQHGSTIIVFAPQGFALCNNIAEGAAIKMGQPLLRIP
jgi:phosphatidylserine decarboxylase